MFRHVAHKVTVVRVYRLQIRRPQISDLWWSLTVILASLLFTQNCADKHVVFLDFF